MKFNSPPSKSARLLVLALAAAPVVGCAAAPRDEASRRLRPVNAAVADDAPEVAPSTDQATLASATAPAGESADDSSVPSDSIIGLDKTGPGLLAAGTRTNGTNGGGVIGALLGGPRRLWNFLRGRPAITPAVAAGEMEDKQFPDERRKGIATLVNWDFGKAAPYTTRYDEIARRDPDPLVRATAIRALNRARHAESDPTFVAALADPEADVRLEAVKALNRMPTKDAAAPLIKLLSDPNQPADVRIAAAEALGHYETLDVARALVAQLNGRDFGVAWQARRSLKQMLGQDFRYDEPAWLSYLTGPNAPVG